MDERRTDTRRRSLLGSRILFEDRRRTLDVTTRNLGPAGAGIEVDPVSEIPARFDFKAKVDEPARPARLVWRRGGRAGIAFEAA